MIIALEPDLSQNKTFSLKMTEISAISQKFLRYGRNFYFSHIQNKIPDIFLHHHFFVYDPHPGYLLFFFRKWQPKKNSHMLTPEHMCLPGAVQYYIFVSESGMMPRTKPEKEKIHMIFSAVFLFSTFFKIIGKLSLKST